MKRSNEKKTYNKQKEEEKANGGLCSFETFWCPGMEIGNVDSINRCSAFRYLNVQILSIIGDLEHMSKTCQKKY